jgi:ADP-heptose:LPS heptosyltransferase
LRDALPDCALLLTGLATEKPLLDAIRADAPQACVFERELSLPELAGVIALGRCIVANSTGPLHVGAAVGTPVVGLYPNRRVCHPRRWGPRSDTAVVLTPPLEKGCSACEKGDCETHDRMERILIDDVLGAVVRQVKGTAEVQTSYTDS